MGAAGMPDQEVYDYIVIGSGFGGSVSAMRLAEKGYSVLVVEQGKRWAPADFPKTNWRLSRYLWLPRLRWFGIQALTFFREVFVISGAGVGGGSLVYANTHMMPKEPFYTNRIWAHFKDWKRTLAPYYERATFMLGTARFEKDYEEDRVLREVADDMGCGGSFRPVDGVGVYLGDPDAAVDPYFKGLGPVRLGCTECAGCMVGCRYDAKNTLDKNYLWFAERTFGARVLAETRVTRVERDGGAYAVHTESSTAWFAKRHRTFRSKGVVVSAGVLGTVRLLLRQKHVYQTLPGLSDTLGRHVMTNSEMLSGVIGADRRLNHGIAISRSFSPDEHTTIEIVKFPDRSGLMVRLGIMAAGDGPPIVRIAKSLGGVARHPLRFLRAAGRPNAPRTSVVFLIMQSLENSMRFALRRGLFGRTLTMRNDGGQKVPTYIAVGQDALWRYAAKVNGVAVNALTEVAFNLASTAHILGGCPMGRTAADGVVDDRFRVHGYENMYVLDGSIVPCNLGVNPSLTITALAEYAMDQIPPKPGTAVRTLDARLADRSAVEAVAQGFSPV